MKPSALAESAVRDPSPPAGLSPALLALWHSRAGHWDRAHDLCQEISGRDGAWIHAHLHREEGDLGNAAYWYARADRPTPPASLSLADEWLELAAALGAGDE